MEVVVKLEVGAVQKVGIKTLTPHPDNPRQGDTEGIKQSLLRFGQVRPLVVVPSGIIVAGNHTHKAALELGWDEVAVLPVDLSPDEAKSYLIADNRLSDKASYDDQALLAVLNDLQSQGLLDGIGFSPDDVDDLAAAIDAVPETTPEQFQGGFAESPEETAARWEGRDEGKRREVVFLLLEEDFEPFRENVEALKKKYELDSMADAIMEAVRREAAGIAA